ncbi:MAG: hypothetical protein U0350_26340 [Caldilineaceae bacterium]
MTTKSRTTYAVFISHNPADCTWVAEVLLPRLTAVGLKVCLSYRDSFTV